MKKEAIRLTVIVFTVVAVLALCTPIVAAQDTMGGPQGNPEAMQRLEKMSAALQLTPQQKKQVAPIIMEEAPKIKALKSDTTTPPRCARQPPASPVAYAARIGKLRKISPDRGFCQFRSAPADRRSTGSTME